MNKTTKQFIDNYMYSATPEMIVDLLVQINDHLMSKHTWLNGVPLTNLAENIVEAEDVIFLNE